MVKCRQGALLVELYHTEMLAWEVSVQLVALTDEGRHMEKCDRNHGDLGEHGDYGTQGN